MYQTVQPVVSGESVLKSGQVAPLLIPQRIDRIGCGGLYGLEADRQKSNNQGETTGQQKYLSPNIDSVGKCLKPFGHDYEDYRYGDEVSDSDQYKKFFGQIHYNFPCRCAEYLPDPDIFDTGFCLVCHESEQTEMREDDGNGREITKE